MCVHMWVYLGKWGESFAIYVRGCSLKVQCFDQKYFSHVEYGSFPFGLWHGHCRTGLYFQMYFCLNMTLPLKHCQLTCDRSVWLQLFHPHPPTPRIYSYSDLVKIELLAVLEKFLLFAI